MKPTFLIIELMDIMINNFQDEYTKKYIWPI